MAESRGRSGSSLCLSCRTAAAPPARRSASHPTSPDRRSRPGPPCRLACPDVGWEGSGREKERKRVNKRLRREREREREGKKEREREREPTLMMTQWAGRLTPHASVAVQTRTRTCPFMKRRSIRFLSERSIPAWWIPNPNGKSAFISRLRDFSTSLSDSL